MRLRIVGAVVLGRKYGLVAPSDLFRVPPALYRDRVPPGYRACLQGHERRREELGPVLARKEIGSGRYHLWDRDRGMGVLCPAHFSCATGERSELWALPVPEQYLGEAMEAVLVPPAQRCGEHTLPWGLSWPRYVERKIVGSLPEQWEAPRMPYWYVWWRLFEIQKGRCACCLASPSVVDHDHRSGAIRGLLCVSCNRMESAYYRRERLCIHESPHCFERYWRNPPALPLNWEKHKGRFVAARYRGSDPAIGSEASRLG